jgi:hypothetical protein
MRRAAVGFRVHSGWTAMIAVAAGKDGLELLVRGRLHLVKTFTYEYRQPYHTAAKLSPDEGRAFIGHVRKESRELAFRALRQLKVELEQQGYSLERCGLLLSSGRPLPPLPRILAAHSLIHTADGELFRESLLHAAGRCSLWSLTIKDRELLFSASRALRAKPASLTRRVAELGRGLGPPWSQDEKLASLVAWLAVSSRANLPRAVSSVATRPLPARAREAR